MGQKRKHSHDDGSADIAQNEKAQFNDLIDGADVNNKGSKSPVGSAERNHDKKRDDGEYSSLFGPVVNKRNEKPSYYQKFKL